MHISSIYLSEITYSGDRYLTNGKKVVILVRSIYTCAQCGKIALLHENIARHCTIPETENSFIHINKTGGR